MRRITHGYKGLSLLVDLNLDRFLMVGALVVSLIAGGFIAPH